MKTLESIVSDRKRCEALKGAGFPQDTALQWVPMDHSPERVADPDWWHVRAGHGGYLWPVAAPTLSEILGELPPEIWRGGRADDGTRREDYAWGRFYLTAGYMDTHPPVVEYRRASDGQVMPIGSRQGWASARDDNPANAAADLYLALHAAGLLTPEAPSPEAPAPASGVPSGETS